MVPTPTPTGSAIPVPTATMPEPTVTILVPTPAPSPASASWLAPQVVVPLIAASLTLAALLFTIASFWWLNARRGKLTTFEPHSYAFAYSSGVIHLRLPLVLQNDGAVPIVVQNLRIRFRDEPKAIFRLPLRNTASLLYPRKGEVPDMPAAFPVFGRSAVQIFPEFGAPFAGFAPERRDYRVIVEVKLGHQQDWAELTTFTWRTRYVTDPGSYLPYSNAPDYLTDEEIERANDAMRTLLTSLLAQDTDGIPD